MAPLFPLDPPLQLPAAIRCLDFIWYHSRTSTATKFHLRSRILAILLHGCETLLLYTTCTANDAFWSFHRTVGLRYT